MYSKSSFDRFGDDLIELVLSYISFEDSFQYKCVSKQWKYLLLVGVRQKWQQPDQFLICAPDPKMTSHTTH